VRQATLEVRKQYDDWKNGRPSSPATVVEKAAVLTKDTPKPESISNQTADLDNPPEAKLKLVSVDESKDQPLSTNSTDDEAIQPVKEVVETSEVVPEGNLSDSGVEPEKEEASPNEVQQPEVESTETTLREQALQALNRDLENQLLVTQESVEKVERDNADLSAKLDSIAEQLQTMQRLIELKDQQVAKLQQQLDQQMLLAQQRNEDPVAAVIDYVRMNPEIVGGSAVAFLLLLLLLIRSSNKPASVRESETRQEKVNEVVSESEPVPVTPTMAVVEPSPVKTAFETSIDPVADDKPDADSESIAKAEAEIQSMIDEVLRARASEQVAQAEMEASGSELSEDPLPIDPQPELVSDNTPETETETYSESEDFLSRANAAMSPVEIDVQGVAENDRVETQTDDDNLDEFFDSELEASLAESDSVESIVEPVEEDIAELQELDFVIEPFDSESVDEPQESLIPAVDMPETGLIKEQVQANSIDEDLVALEALMDEVAAEVAAEDAVEVASVVEADASSDESWEFVVEESDSGALNSVALDNEIEKIFDEVDGDLEVVEEINDTAESEDFDTHFYSGADENETRLDLARAYIEMDDYEAARDILVSMKDKGSSAQQQEVTNLLDQLDKA
jgi:pilus assembly protein FimV